MNKDEEKKLNFARAYGAGEIVSGRLVGEYPAPAALPSATPETDAAFEDSRSTEERAARFHMLARKLEREAAALRMERDELKREVAHYVAYDNKLIDQNAALRSEVERLREALQLAETAFVQINLITPHTDVARMSYAAIATIKEYTFDAARKGGKENG